MGIDDAIRQMKEDEETDRVQEQTRATPIDYARLRTRTTGKNLAPQRVYYYIRTRKLKLESCVCGRNVIDIKKADELFGFSEKEEDRDEREENDDEPDL